MVTKMADLETLKKQLNDKELEFRNLSDSILLSGGADPEQNAKREQLKSELQLRKDEIMELDESDAEEDWETDAESNNMGS